MPGEQPGLLAGFETRAKSDFQGVVEVGDKGEGEAKYFLWWRREIVSIR